MVRVKKKRERKKIKKPPIARRYDSVERLDLSRMFGVVKKVFNGYAIIEWQDKEKPEIRKEKIKDLALVRRI